MANMRVDERGREKIAVPPDLVRKLATQLSVDPVSPNPRLLEFDRQELLFWAEIGLKMALRSSQSLSHRGRPKTQEPLLKEDRKALLAIRKAIDDSFEQFLEFEGDVTTFDLIDFNSALKIQLKKYPVEQRDAARHRLVRYWDKQSLPAGLGSLAYLRGLSKIRKSNKK